MGQRTQVYLIARVYSPEHDAYKHRCIGAFHHQWSRHDQPVRALHRFITLLRQEENAAAARAELRWLNDLVRAGEDLPDPAVPCPYILSLLAISWTTDLEHQTFLSSNSFTAGLMDAREPCWEKGHCDSHSWYVVQ